MDQQDPPMFGWVIYKEKWWISLKMVYIHFIYTYIIYLYIYIVKLIALSQFERLLGEMKEAIPAAMMNTVKTAWS